MKKFPKIPFLPSIENESRRKKTFLLFPSTIRKLENDQNLLRDGKELFAVDIAMSELISK
jgi:hypothetical protein